MKTNILKVILNLEKVKDFRLNNIYKGKNKINNVGDALEYFIKDLFCGTLSVSGIAKKDKAHSRFISYSGNQNNPPDFIIKDSDAIEVKKLEKIDGSIALNSSYPKAKLYIDDPRISAKCRECDGGRWEEKDTIYSIGSVINKQIKLLWFIYGTCYAADKEIYLRVFNKISEEINSVKDVSFSKTVELARINKVDPLGITYFRIRGMWGIKSPQEVFKELIDYKPESSFRSYCLIPDSKYNDLPKEDKDKVKKSTAEIKDVKIKSPNNPAKYLKAKLISITKN